MVESKLSRQKEQLDVIQHHRSSSQATTQPGDVKSAPLHPFCSFLKTNCSFSVRGAGVGDLEPTASYEQRTSRNPGAQHPVLPGLLKSTTVITFGTFFIPFSCR